MSATLTVNGAGLQCDRSGALYWPDQETLVVADLHLEKGSAYAAGGQLLPPYDTAATLRALGQAIAHYRPRRVICLGDSFHDAEAGARVAPSDAATIQGLTASADWVWITGNHDPAPPEDWGGMSLPEVTLAALVFRHEARPDPSAGAGEVSGHFHPKAAVRVRNRRLSTRCFVTDGRRLILPAFGAYTGGLNVLDPAISDLFPKGFQVQMLGRDGVYRYPRNVLAA